MMVRRKWPGRCAWMATPWALFFVLLIHISQARAQGDPAREAHDLILELELERAEKVLESTTMNHARIAQERGLLLLYRTDYDAAVEILERGDLSQTKEGGRLAALARDSARSMAGAYVAHDLARGVIVRMQDDHDLVLVPILAEVVHHTRRTLIRDLGVALPWPVRIELVRDHFSLAAMTGLPEQSARTTGAVAVANWGRVAMISPRAMTHGYPWLDTLAHELTHLALGKGTRDRAPLWLQEGVAKVQEKRWRAYDPFDDYPSADWVAGRGMILGLARPLDDFGPSIAMLPSPVQAMVAFAEAESFVRFFTQRSRPKALPDILVGLRDRPQDGLGGVMREATGRDLAGWDKAWRADLARRVPQDDSAKGDAAASISSIVGETDIPAKATQSTRLGALLLERGHAKAASVVLDEAQKLAPHRLHVRGLLGRAYLQLQREDKAWGAVESTEPPMIPDADAFVVKGRILTDRGDQVGGHVQLFRALALDPWNARVACEMLDEPRIPKAELRGALCEAARRWPRD